MHKILDLDAFKCYFGYKLLKIFNKFLIKEKLRKLSGLNKNPVFYFTSISIILLGLMCLSCQSFASTAIYGNGKICLSKFSGGFSGQNSENLFFSQSGKIALETPDLKIVQDNCVFGISAPNVVSAKVLGDIFGSSQSNKREVAAYIVQSGDTLQSIASANNISVNTLAWANDMSASSSIKVGQELAILPVDGVLHVIKSGDTVGGVASKYVAKSDEIIAFNDLASQDDIYIGDILIVPGGTMPKKSTPILNNQIPVANNYYIFPAQGYVAQLLHYFNAIDLANKCGTPIYAAAAGTVQRAVGNGLYNQGMGNHITILHSNGTVTYYGHLMSLFVKPGEKVDVGQNIALMGGQPGMPGAGKSTGCHVHFQVVGAANPLAKYAKGTTISYK